MTAKIVDVLINSLMTYVIIPLSWIIIDYFKMKKTIKSLNAEINALKEAKTIQEKIDAANNIP